MKTVKKVVHYILAAIADVVQDEPVIVTSLATIGAVWVVGILGLPKTTVEVVRGAELAGAAAFVRFYVTPNRPPLVKATEAEIEKAAAPVVKKAAKAAPAALASPATK